MLDGFDEISNDKKNFEENLFFNKNNNFSIFKNYKIIITSRNTDLE